MEGENRKEKMGGIREGREKIVVLGHRVFWGEGLSGKGGLHWEKRKKNLEI